MILSESDAVWAADEFISYFENFTSIEDYLRHVKKELVSKTNQMYPLADNFFNEDIHPNEMEFAIKFVGKRFEHSVPQEHYNNLLNAVSSHNNESNIPGRELRWMIYEKNTNKVLGLYHLNPLDITILEVNFWHFFASLISPVRP
mgnify:CR=1 FL=1